MEGPHLIEGGSIIDDRGSICFVNDFSFEAIKRFYAVGNHKAGFVRAWHAHKREAKYVMALAGAAIVAAVRIDDWNSPSKDLPVHRFVLSAEKPAILYIPAGFANGFMNLTENTKLIFFSTSNLNESQQDDIRYDAYYWDAWRVVER